MTYVHNVVNRIRIQSEICMPLMCHSFEVLRNSENFDLTVCLIVPMKASYWINVNKDHVPFWEHNI